VAACRSSERQSEPELIFGLFSKIHSGGQQSFGGEDSNSRNYGASSYNPDDAGGGGYGFGGLLTVFLKFQATFWYSPFSVLRDNRGAVLPKSIRRRSGGMHFVPSENSEAKNLRTASARGFSVRSRAGSIEWRKDPRAIGMPNSRKRTGVA